MNARKWMFLLAIMAILGLAVYRVRAASHPQPKSEPQSQMPQPYDTIPQAGHFLGSLPLPAAVDHAPLLARPPRRFFSSQVGHGSISPLILLL
jgi:energy-converting hydrogenase Eha subunit F